MKSPLRQLVALVLAILAGTFFSVRAYLGTFDTGPSLGPRTGTTTWVVPDLEGVQGIETEAGESVQDDNCPTCAAAPSADGEVADSTQAAS